MIRGSCDLVVQCRFIPELSAALPAELVPLALLALVDQKRCPTADSVFLMWTSMMHDARPQIADAKSTEDMSLQRYGAVFTERSDSAATV